MIECIINIQKKYINEKNKTKLQLFKYGLLKIYIHD